MRSANETWHDPTKVVLILQIGVEYSEAAFAYLQEGLSPSLHPITSWPGQERGGPTGTVPTVMWYDNGQKMVSAGAEALSYEIEEAAEDNGWRCVKGLPQYLSTHLAGTSDSNLDSLPPGVSVSAIYTDYLNYLLRHSIEFFIDRMVDGRAIWKELSPDMTVVFIHPQGWSTREGAFLRTAFRKLDSPYSNCEVRLISQPAVWTLGYISDLKPSPSTGGNVLVCRIEKSLVEVTTYEIERIVTAHNLGYQTNSRLQTGFGAIIQNFYLHLSAKLGGAGLNPEDVQEYSSNGAKDFEQTAMRVFTPLQQEQSIQIGGPRFNNSEIRIRRGRMTVDGKTMEGFFEPCVSAIVEEIQRQKANCDIQHIIIVEDVGTSRYLQHRLNQHFDSTGCRITYAPKNFLISGAVMHAINDLIASTTLAASLGILVGERYDPSALEHHGRKVYHGHGGYGVVANRWSEIVKAGTEIDPASSVRRQIIRSLNPSRNVAKGLGKYICDLWSFDGGEDEPPRWAKDENGGVNEGFQRICRVEADLSEYNGALTRKYQNTRPRDALEVSLVISQNGLRYEAHIEWTEKGTTKKGPASTIKFE